jgi:hypothetical protein
MSVLFVPFTLFRGAELGFTCFRPLYLVAVGAEQFLFWLVHNKGAFTMRGG